MQSPFILSAAKGPIAAYATVGSARSFLFWQVRTGNWQLSTDN